MSKDINTEFCSESDFCKTKCRNIEGNGGFCCTVGDRNWIIGPIPDHMEVLERIKAMKPDVEIAWDDCFMGYEEGSKLFPERPAWTNPDYYPCMRIDIDSDLKECVFYDASSCSCTIYEARSITCSKYKCKELKIHSKKREKHIEKESRRAERRAKKQLKRTERLK